MIYKVALIICVIISSNVIFAEQFSITSFDKSMMKNKIKKLILSDFNDLIEPNVVTTIKTDSIFEEKPSNALYVFVDFAKPETFLGKLLLDIVYLSEKNEIISEHKCLVESELTSKVYVPVRKLSTNTIITKNDISMKRIAIKSNVSDFIFKEDQIIGKQTKRSMMKDVPFTYKWVEIVPFIEKGESVYAVVKSPGYQIKCEAIALESGMIGDRIRMRSGISKKILRGEILNDKSILVVTN